MRKVMFIIFAFVCAKAGFLSADCSCSSHSPSHMWKALHKGNQKFVDSPIYARQREPLVHGQNPHTIILSCSDSRVPPEIIFSQKLGEMFVVRTAGQVTDDVVIDTIEYAVGHFDSTLLVVMGHADCGAVKGALNRLIENDGKIDKKRGHLNAVLIPIERAILKSKMDIYAPDALKKAIRVNIRYVARQLIKRSKTISEAIKSGRITLVGAEYHLDSGEAKKLFTFKAS